MRRWRRPEPAAAQPAAAGPPAAAPGAAAAPAPGHDRKDPAGHDYSQPGAAMPAAAAPAATRPRFDAASGAWTGADGKPLWSPNPRMAPPWLTRAMVKAALVAMAAILAWKALGALYPLIMVVVTAIFVALAIEPPVDWLVRKGWRRGLATGAVMVGVFALLGAATAAFGSLLVGQIKDLVEQIPEVYEQVAQWLSKQFGAEIPTQNEALQQVVQSWGSQLAQNAWAVGTQVFSGLISGLGGILLVYYISAQGPKFRATICSPLPPVHQRVVLKVWATAQDKTAGYISSRVILAV
ncbi:MAG: AI-2E family transporter, partial [Bifidobacteriaceae bacterium]|nr:AI-2E family transporter [Bifidobacteriaceae bacterium]